jgi:hypothetical protein
MGPANKARQIPTRRLDDWLVANIPTDKAILQRWLKAGYLHNRVLHSTQAGTPQGGIVSPALMNMTLDGLERALHAQFGRRARNPTKVHIVRYADDFIVTGATREMLADVALGTATASAKERSMDQGEVFPGRWLESLGLRHRNRQDARHRRAQTSDAVRHRQHADTAAPENQGRRQPVRPPHGKTISRSVLASR